MNDLLTIGMATRGEPDSVYFTLSALAANHPRVRYIVVDNTPEKCPRTEAITRAVGGLYVHRPDLTGTSAPRDAVFRFAQTPWVMCIDSHVIFPHVGAKFGRFSVVELFLDWIRKNPDSRDLVQGPMQLDDGQQLYTHWNIAQRPGLWGVWQKTFVDREGNRFAPEVLQKENVTLLRDVMTGDELKRVANMPNLPGVYGWRQIDATDDPYEIPLMGLGCWAMRRDAWPGFNPLFTGFGGEEGYIHEVVRRRGGRAMCLPFLQWRHKFRDVGGKGSNPPAPYPHRTEDHVWNLLIGHRELGINADEAIYAHFGKKIDVKRWPGLVKAADAIQPFGGPRGGPKRHTILAVWYTDNSAPLPLIQKSLNTLRMAANGGHRHKVKVITVGWEPIPGNPLPFIRYEGPRERSHATILNQIRQGMAVHASGEEVPDAVAFCEHDVLYPADYFERHGDALGYNPKAQVSSHRDYIGLNETGWLAVVQRDEPMHQLCVRWDKMTAHLDSPASAGHVEPDHGQPRADWVRGKHGGPMPSVHVNHKAGRFTSHGEVCYAKSSGGVVDHGYWGEARLWWPGEIVPVEKAPAAQVSEPLKPAAAKEDVTESKTGGCGNCEGDKHNSLQSWFDAVRVKPSDFHEHAATVKELADRCDRVAEISAWPNKPTLISLAASGAKHVTSYARKPKREWAKLTQFRGESFRGVTGLPVEVEPCDLLILDTDHDAVTVYDQLNAHAKNVSRYILIHCTTIYGESGDNGKNGVNHAIRRFLKERQEWTSVASYPNNYGLCVLSRDDRDKKQPPGTWRKLMNFAQDVTSHLKDGWKPAPKEVFAARLELCVMCPDRFHDKCGACGCPLAEKASWASEECGRGKIAPDPTKPLLWHAYKGPTEPGVALPDAGEIQMVTVGYDMDGTINNTGLAPVPGVPYVVITGRPDTESERRRTVRELVAQGFAEPAAVIHRDVTAYPDSDAGIAGHKAAAIKRLGVTKYFEDNRRQVALIRAAVPGCEVVLVGPGK